VKVAIMGESSGIIRDAFARLGHDAISCDLLPTQSPGPHYQGDMFDIIDYPWDLAISHPECTHLAVSGSRHFEAKWNDGRQAAAVAFFMRVVRRSEHIPKTAIEQPVSIMSTLYRKPDQIIQPNEYGEDASKATCLWLKGLPLLIPTKHVPPRIVDGKPRWGNQTDSGQNKLTPSEDRWKLRSATYPGIADAMADQWGRPQKQLEFAA
jgi:hypothetical protein